MAISSKIEKFMEESSWIRKMFEEGLRLKKERGAENVQDLTLGNPVMEPPKAFKDRLIEAGVPVTFKRFEDARHGFDLMGEPGAEEAWQMTIDHLRRYLRQAGPSARWRPDEKDPDPPAPKARRASPLAR